MSFISLIFGVALAASPIQPTSCPSMPYGLPTDNNLHICHKGYYTDYNTTYHIPEFVGWNLTKVMTVSCNIRNGSFTQDPMANGEDVSPSEYNHSGYDRGHMANAADFLSNEQEETESFYMTNLLPQNPTNNRSGWKYLEEISRDVAYQYGDVEIYAGGIVSENNIKMKDVSVPQNLWKVIYIPSQNKAFAIIVPNTAINGKDILNYQVSVSTIESKIGKIIPLPTNYNKSNIDNLEFKQIKLGKMIGLKQNVCSIADHKNQ